jgi:hypothetical protein
MLSFLRFSIVNNDTNKEIEIFQFQNLPKIFEPNEVIPLL